MVTGDNDREGRREYAPLRSAPGALGTATQPRTFSPVEASLMTDWDLLGQQRALATARRLLEAGAAAVAAEIAHRSRPELADSGLSIRLGAVSPEALIARVAGVSSADARALVSVGVMIGTPPPGMSPVASAVSHGELGVDAARAIHVGLGCPDRHVDTDTLSHAAEALVASAGELSVDQLAHRARALREELETADELRRLSRDYLSSLPAPGVI